MDIEPVSVSGRERTVDPDGPIELQLPTRLSEQRWRALLDDERDTEPGGYVTGIDVREGDPYDRLTITLNETVAYDLRIAKVSVGADSTAAEPHYIDHDTPSETTIPDGGSRRLTAVVRDRYNNPVSGVTVSASVTGTAAGTLDDQTVRTDENGLATFRYQSTGPGTDTVELSFAGGETTLERLAFTVESVTAGGGSDATGPVVADIETNQTAASGQSVQQGTTLTLDATASDFQRGGTDIYAAEWWSNRTAPGGGAGNGFVLSPTDGTFDTVEERVTARGLDTTDWDTGTHSISVRARDANGNWGPVNSDTIELTGTESGAAESTAYLSGTATTNNADNRFRFDIDTGGEAVTLQSAGVDTTALGGPRDGMRDVRIDGTNERTDSTNYVSDGTLQQLANPAITGTATVEFGNFDNGAGNRKIPAGPYTYQSTQPTGDYLSVGLQFDDGTTKTLYFVPP